MTLSLTGSIQKKYEYRDYSQRSLDSKTEILDNEFGYNGEAHTVDGLQYLRSRYYDPVTGVFISADSYRTDTLTVITVHTSMMIQQDICQQEESINM